MCATLIASVGITRVVAKKRYHGGQDSREIFAQAGVRLDVVEDVVEQY